MNINQKVKELVQSELIIIIIMHLTKKHY